MSSDARPVIEVNGLGKRYLLGEEHARDSLAESVGAVFRHPLRSLRRMLPGSATRAELWALRHLDLEVRPGEVLGVVGPNGAGKTTLLKLLALITDPSEGQFTLRGRTASLLAVGTGFHWELTGRENVYLSGTILGMRKREIDRRFDEIVDFAGVGEFLDTPVKRYSSGMYVRLGFAVAAHLDAEILLVDEVLAVGDAAFRRKCVGAMDEVARRGRTIVFVSHDMAAIQLLCTRALLLDHGRVAAEGAPADVVGRYLHTASRPLFEAEGRTGRAQLLSVALDAQDDAPGLLRAAAPLRVRAAYVLPEPHPGLSLEFVLLGRDGLPVYEVSTADDGIELPARAGEHTLEAVLPADLLLPGDHHLGVTLRDAAGLVLDRREPALSFTLPPGAEDAAGPRAHLPRRGVVRARCAWTLGPS